MRYPIRGFTLVELIMVVILIGVLSVAAMISFSANRQHSVVVQADELRRAISHAQLIAISQGIRLRLTTTATGYSVAKCTATDCSATSPLADPATGSPFGADFSGENITLSAGTIDFDSLGRPQSAGTLLSTETTFTFTGGGNSASVSILPITGFAQAS